MFLRKNMVMQKKLLWVAMALSIIAMLDTVYLTYLHFSDAKPVCDLGGQFSCEVVNKSSYAEILGIPVSLLGFAISLIASYLILSKMKNKRIFGFKPLRLAIFLLTGSLVFAGYLLFVQAFLLLAYCLFCLLFDLLLASMLAIIVFYEVKP